MEVYLGEELVKVNIIRKNNKNIYFRFDDNLNLVVTANKWISKREIEKLILQNEKSLERMLKKCQKKVTSGTEFWYLGNKYNIIYDINEEDIIFDEGTLICKNQDTLDKFIKMKTKEIFTFEVDKMREVIVTPPFTLKIRKMKTRWGVCNYKSMTITLNSELIKYQRENLRYVITHEMCHFYHHNHGPLFWDMVGKYYPDYKVARKELRS